MTTRQKGFEKEINMQGRSFGIEDKMFLEHLLPYQKMRFMTLIR